MLAYYSAITFICAAILSIAIYGVITDGINVGKKYAYVFLTILIAALGEWTGEVLDGNKTWMWLHASAKFLEFSVAPLIPILMAEIMAGKDLRKYYMPYIVIHSLLEFASIYTGWIFQVDKNGAYSHGQGYNIYVVTYILAYIYMIICVSMYCGKNRYRNKVFLSFVIIFLALGVVFQTITDIHVDWLCASACALLMYLHFSTQEQKRALDQLEEKAEEANRANASKTSFLSRMSHDVRTPINGITGMLRIAQKNIDKPEVVNDCLTKIDQASSYLLSLLNDVLDVTKLESGHVQLEHVPFDLMEVVEQCLTIMEQLAAEKSITISTNISVIGKEKLLGSPQHVRQILLNILTNGIKYNRVSGTLEVSAQVVYKGNDKAIYRFLISDNGIGMSQDFQKHIFEPFSREAEVIGANYQGTGLGMAIVKELVDKMGGSIKVMSEKNVGSTFVLDLPFEVDPSPVEEKEEKNGECSFDGKHILVVEDNSLNLEIASYMLNEMGFLIDAAHNGKEAVFRFQSSPEGYYSYVLMDVMMPMMNGIEATREIRKLHRQDAKAIPIIAMTANAFEEDKRETMEAGMNEHLTKPLDPETVRSTLARYS